MKRRADIDWVRTVSALGVILIHSSSQFVGRSSRYALLSVTPAMLCNQAFRFCVPVFFMLSGLGLGLSGQSFRLLPFWFRRFRRIGVPYVLWSAFYFLQSNHFLVSRVLTGPALQTFCRLLLTGGAASHLWFLPVLLQFYLLYPALKPGMERRPGLTLALSFLLSMYCTLAVRSLLPFPSWWKARLWRLFPVWLFYFTLGMAMTGERLERIALLARKYAIPICLFVLIAAFAYAADARRSGDLESVKPQLFLYSPLCFLGIAASWKWFARIPGMSAASGFLARHSMTLYFSHVFFLNLLRRRTFFSASFFTMLLMDVVVTALSALTALLPEEAKRWAKRRALPPGPG